ncbi:hypothetical protein IWZ00DRAFT_567988 [Phyllosticta capitalensis]
MGAVPSVVYRYNSVPRDYTTPPFPSLYWPFPVRGHQAYYLYDAGDIWRFTLTWTLLFFGAVHLATSAYAVIVQWRNWEVIWIVPVIYCVIGGIEAVIAGSIVGGLLGGVYSAGYFSMSTWMPFVWAFINTLVLILSSFAIQGSL